MKKKNLFYLIVLAAIISSCSSSFKVTTDFDQAADFTNYNTFNFTEEALNLPVNQFNRTRVLNAMEEQMELKGFKKSDVLSKSVVTLKELLHEEIIGAKTIK